MSYRLFLPTDLLALLLYWKVIGDKYFVLHHCTSLFAFSIILVRAGAHSSLPPGGGWGWGLRVDVPAKEQVLAHWDQVQTQSGSPSRRVLH